MAMFSIAYSLMFPLALLLSLSWPLLMTAGSKRPSRPHPGLMLPAASDERSLVKNKNGIVKKPCDISKQSSTTPKRW